MKARRPTLWVHRLSAADSGSPEAKVALADVENDLEEVARAVMVGPRYEFKDESDQALAFLVSELFDRGVMRQGWGAPGMRADRESQFLKNYIIAMWRYWNAIPVSVRDDLKGNREYSRIFSVLEPYYRQAAGRLTIIMRMIEMRRGDMVFLPKVPQPASFTLARIDDPQYTFDDRFKPDPKEFWDIDYGHCRRVRDVRQFQYGATTLAASTFGSPYLHAIDPVSAREGELREFIERHYRE